MDRDLTDYFLYALAAVLVLIIMNSGSVALAAVVETGRAVTHEQANPERERVRILPSGQDMAKQILVA